MLLVTGASGLSGSAIIREFARQGYPIRALVRNRAKAQALETLPTVEIVEGDMLRPGTLADALSGVERVLLISTADQQMAETQCAFIEAARKAGVHHIIKFSGAESGVGFNQRNFRFTRMHEDVEHYLEQSGLAWTHLRPSQFMQVYLREAPTIIAQDALFLPMENARLSPIDIEDIAKIACALLRTGREHEGKSYDMTGPESLTMTDVAEQISRAIGRNIRYVNVTPAERRQALLAKGGVSAYFADALDEQVSERLKCAEAQVCLDAHKEFGIEPTTFAEFARRNAAVFRGELARS
ncbi:SDR family oxidoreductase [Ktedonobacter robiniae]|uniref:NAD(P)-dependent oxidoreductase n=1 Tax=Ktedonobacter robiniae TaxID=2778365 RepID=A0ABQ3UKJ3_9CHLR|nr:SDR family oxidoreductase [Ktedonobacter robiniae]GHO53242.1 NAD(P)-dependent oxidoreductase [Ktedonobacter robiniae]